MSLHTFNSSHSARFGALHMKVRTLIDVEEWQQTADRTSYATFFHTPDWYQLFIQTYPQMQIKTKKFIFTSGKTAVLPLMKIAAGKMHSQYISGPAGVYGGWISSENLDKPHMNLILTYMQHKIPNLMWRLNPFAPDVQSLNLQPSRDDFTQVLDLNAGIDIIVKQWTKGHRAAVNQARHSGVRIECATTLEEWCEYYFCYQDSLQRWGTRASSRYDWPFFENMYHLRPKKIRLWLAKKESQILAGALCFYHNQHVVYWHGAAYQHFFQLRPSNLLQYEIIKDAIQNKYYWYDFNPSGGHQNVSNFKKSFGTCQRPCPLFHFESRWSHFVRAFPHISTGW
jgi:hypothetical protein